MKNSIKSLIPLTVLILCSISGVANAGISAWSDKTICRLVNTTPTNIEYQTELTSRGLSCGGAVTSASTTNVQSLTTKVKVEMKPFNGDWMNESIFPASLKERLNAKYRWIVGIFYGDMDGDGIDDLVTLAAPKLSKNILSGPEHIDKTNSAVCDITTTVFDCYDERNNIEIYLIKDNTTFTSWNAKKQRMVTTRDGFGADNISKRLGNNNPIEMQIQGSNTIKLADFNGDGVLDIFASDAGLNIWDGNKNRQNGKNDLYYLSQPNGSWLESTATHVTGTKAKKGKGLFNYSHNATVGDIDGDGDIDIVVPSNKWVGKNSEIMCYVNQGNGHMKVRQCGNQFGWEVELGDVDNDGDLDILFGGSLHNAAKEWGYMNTLPSCSSSRCLGAFSGVLLNDGTGNFYKRGFEFPEYKNSNGFSYSQVPNISVADLDGDGDLDVVRSLIGVDYAGFAMAIEENIGNGQFRTALIDEWCKGPESKSTWQIGEGGKYNCGTIAFKFGDFNKDGFIDIVVDNAPHAKKMFNHRIVDGTVFLSTGKFTYDTINPDDRKYPLANVGDCSYLSKCDVIGSTEVDVTVSDTSQQEVEAELAAFEAELEAELNQ
jgi:hypothetical protein